MSVIEVRDVVKTFGTTRALNGLNLELSQGEVHGFLGPNGAGKTTMIRTLLGLYKATSGTVRVFGLDPARRSAEINRRLAYVPGDVVLWEKLTGQQVLDALGGLRGKRDEGRERRLIERFELDPSKRIRTYSKGNRQKVALVAAFAAPVELLVLDEPTSGLDPLMEQVFGDCVEEATRAGRTVLLSSHILGEVERLCTRVTIVKDGRTVESGSLQELRHLSSTSITVRTSAAGAAGLVHELQGHGFDPREDMTTADQHIVTIAVGRARVPEVLAVIVEGGFTEVTCAEASLEDLFLRHYAQVRG